MRIERLVAMANDIGAFFDAGRDKAEAARSVASWVYGASWLAHPDSFS